MTTQTKQQDPGQLIAELYQNTFFQRYWRAIGRFIGRGKQSSLWLSVAIVMGINLLLGVTVSILLGETQFTTMTAIFVNFMWVTYGFLMILLFIPFNTRMVEFLRLRFVKSLQDEDSIHELVNWANRWFGNRSAQFFFSLSFGIVIALLTFYSIYPSTKFSVGQTFIYFMCFFHVAVAAYALIVVLMFASTLDKLNLTLYPDDPASSPILLQLSKQFSDFILVFAVASAGLLLLNGLVGSLNIRVIVLTLVVAWIPMFALFFTANQAFSQQIVRVKHKRLELLQSEIMKLSDAEKLDRDTVADITSLIDYHDRIKSSRNSLYSAESFINLIGSLALPTLGAVLSVIDIWQKIFGKP